MTQCKGLGPPPVWRTSSCDVCHTGTRTTGRIFCGRRLWQEPRRRPIIHGVPILSWFALRAKDSMTANRQQKTQGPGNPFHSSNPRPRDGCCMRYCTCSSNGRCPRNPKHFKLLGCSEKPLAISWIFADQFRYKAPVILGTWLAAAPVDQVVQATSGNCTRFLGRPCSIPIPDSLLVAVVLAAYMVLPKLGTNHLAQVHQIILDSANPTHIGTCSQEPERRVFKPRTRSA